MTDNNQTFISLNYDCNNNCVSCIRETGVTPNPSFDEVKQSISKILSASQHIEFNGGEPTLRKDIFRILKYASSINPDAEIALLTNSRVFSKEENAKRLAGFGIRNLKVITSIYGENSSVHESVTRTKGSFEQQVKGIKNLVNLGISIELRVIINKLNCTHLEKIEGFISDNFEKKDFLSVDFVNPKICGQSYVNRNLVIPKISEVVPFLGSATKNLEAKGFNVRLFHFPLCTLPDSFRHLAKGITSEEGTFGFAGKCEQCSVKKMCSGIWRGYTNMFGEGEIKPFVHMHALDNKEICKRVGMMQNDVNMMEKMLFLMGFKNVLRLSLDYPIRHLLNSLEGFPYAVDREKGYLFVSYDLALAEKAKRITGMIDKPMSTEKSIEMNAELGKLYGYPECCSRKFFSNPEKYNEFYDFVSFRLCDSFPEFKLFHIPCTKDCPATKELIERIKAKAEKIGISGMPIQVPKIIHKIKKTVIFTGYSCNNNCIFCCNSGKRKKIPDEALPKIKARIAKAAKDGASYLEIVGGEPTIRKGLLSIIKFARKIGFDTIMFATNGRMLANMGFAKSIVEAGVSQIVFSVHGHNAGLHDSLTRVPGSFAQLMKGIENLKSLGFGNIGTNTTIVKQNYHHLLEIGRLILGIGSKCSEFIFVDPTRGAAYDDFNDIVPTYEEVSPYVNRLLELGKSNNMMHWQVRYYPLCFVNEKYHSMISEIHEKNMFVTNQYAPDFESINASKGRAEIGRVKLEKCRSCKYESKCEGYWKEYTLRRK